MNNLIPSQLLRVLSLLIFVTLTSGFSSKSFAAESPVAERTANFSLDPIGFINGISNLGMEWQIIETVSAGPTLSYSNFGTGGMIGFGATLTFTPGHSVFSNGWFIRPFVEYATASSNLSTATATGAALGSYSGYWWFWDNGLNLGAGLGFQYLAINMAAIGLNYSNFMPTGMAQIGYSF